MERAIDFLLKSQANLEARIEQGNTNLRASIAEVNKNLGESIAEGNKNLRASIEEVDRMLGERIARTDEQIAQTNEQLRQTNRHLGEFADTQMEFIQVMTRTWESQGGFNKSMRTAYRKLAQKVDKLADSTGGSGKE